MVFQGAPRFSKVEVVGGDGCIVSIVVFAGYQSVYGDLLLLLLLLLLLVLLEYL